MYDLLMYLLFIKKTRGNDIKYKKILEKAACLKRPDISLSKKISVCIGCRGLG